MSTQYRRRLDVILEPAFVADLGEVELAELRERRATAEAVETELSFYRRLLHGRMDLLAFELRRRSGEERRSLIEALPEILGAGETASGQVGRRMDEDFPALPDVGRRDIDRVLGDDFLTRLPDLDDDQLQAIQEMLTTTEAEVSNHRRAVQVVFDTLQAEISRRYRDGGARGSDHTTT